jgi:hypothetical protein
VVFPFHQLQNIMSPNTMALTPYGSNGSTDLTMAVLGCGKSKEIPVVPDTDRHSFEGDAINFCGCSYYTVLIC